MGNDSSQPLKYGERLDNDITVKWKKVACENPFPPRESHCSCSIDRKLYVFGCVKQGDDGEPVELNDLLVYDLGTETDIRILDMCHRASWGYGYRYWDQETNISNS